MGEAFLLVWSLALALGAYYLGLWVGEMEVDRDV